MTCRLMPTFPYVTFTKTSTQTVATAPCPRVSTASTTSRIMGSPKATAPTSWPGRVLNLYEEMWMNCKDEKSEFKMRSINHV